MFNRITFNKAIVLVFLFIFASYIISIIGNLHYFSDNKSRELIFGPPLYYEIEELDSENRIYLQNSNREIKIFYIEKDTNSSIVGEKVSKFVIEVDKITSKVINFYLYCFYVFMMFFVCIFLCLDFRKTGSLTSLIFPILMLFLMSSRYYNSLFLLILFIPKYSIKQEIRKCFFIIGLICFVSLFYKFILNGIDLYSEIFNLVNEADLIFESIVVPNS